LGGILDEAQAVSVFPLLTGIHELAAIGTDLPMMRDTPVAVWGPGAPCAGMALFAVRFPFLAGLLPGLVGGFEVREDRGFTSVGHLVTNDL